MFWKKRNVQDNEQFRLISSIEKARQSWSEVQAWRIDQEESLESQIPKVLAEVRYRFLLREARQRQYVNRWYFEFHEANRTQRQEIKSLNQLNHL